MDFFITFFRDILDGPTYTIVSIICGILFCSCIGYLAEVHFNKKKQAIEYQNTHAEVSLNTPNNMGNMNMQPNVQQNMQSMNQNYASAPNVFQNNQEINNIAPGNIGSVKEKK